MQKRIWISVAVLTVIIAAAAVIVFSLHLRSDNLCPLSFTVSSGATEREISAYYSRENGIYYVFLPSYADLENTHISTGGASDVTIGGEKADDGSDCARYSLGETYELRYYHFGAEVSKIKFVKSDGVATAFIDTTSGSMEYINEEKGNEERGKIIVYLPDGSVNYEGSLEHIKGRGNSTWFQDKKPYSIKLDYAADLLNMGEAKKWVLIANAGDRSFLRDKLMYDLADDAGLSFSPDSDWVDLYLNGEYAGLYLLSERNDIGENRIDIEDASSGENSSFVVSKEVESRMDAQGQPYFKTRGQQSLRIHEPDNVTEAQIAAFSRLFQMTEDAITASAESDEYLNFIDLDSWVRKYLLEEIGGSTDAGYLSQYFYRNDSAADDKIYAGPAWDYDGALSYDVYSGNARAFIANRLYAKTSARILEERYTPWFYYLYRNETFYKTLTDVFESDFLPVIRDYVEYKIDSYYNVFKDAAVIDRLRWYPDEGEDVCRKSVETVKNCLAERTEFLKSAWVDGVEYCNVYLDDRRNELDKYMYYSVVYGETFDAPIPTRAGEKLVGWYDEATGETFDFSQPVTQNVWLYAVWQSDGTGSDSETAPVEHTTLFTAVATVFVFAVIFAALIIIDIRRTRGQKNER